MATSRFVDVELAPPVPVFALTARYREDNHPNKYNLGVGAYRTDEGLPWVLPVVRTVEQQMAADPILNHEYLPVCGLDSFCKASTKLVLGDDASAIAQNRASGVQTLSGTGALRLGAEFLKRCLGMNVMYHSKPTWGNHIGIFKDAGFTDIREYRYWDASTKGLDIKGLLEDLRAAPEDSVVILHACAHNPTGVDPNPSEWEQIMQVVKEKRLFPFFDSAYQGFASGDLDRDAFAVRMFEKADFEMMISQSFSKNFGLYNERTGNLAIVAKDPESLRRVRSQMEKIARPMWSNPPNHGCRIVATVLGNAAFFAEWKDNIRTMSSRISDMRRMLHEKLRQLKTPGNWDHITNQIGMFSFTGLGSKQVDYIINKYHVYLMNNGRINMCAITTGNAEYIASAINDAVSNVTEDPKL
ncbi:aspartate aminotransferase, cytoplasmic-like [Branchiostoma lanceolatum]|uniref:aspartate aminotransferase, cytoplasmic-like n=1 Tax=Branchiostoma lanceolatum TaxID=7740 RepID=UPI003452CC59